jgi:REP element-mobilizing transposase RayT
MRASGSPGGARSRYPGDRITWHCSGGCTMDTYLSLRVHLVWATKDRRPWLDPEWRSRLFACAATIITRKGGRLLCAGGVKDHIHLYVEIPATITIAKLVNVLKSNTARWIHHSFPHRRDFSWQHGYGAFSVSASSDASLRDYIRNQERHHAEKPLTDEYQSLLNRHGIEYALTQASD